MGCNCGRNRRRPKPAQQTPPAPEAAAEQPPQQTEVVNEQEPEQQPGDG